MAVIVAAVLTGMLVALAGTIPRNLLFAANLRFLPGIPWAVPITAGYLWFGWRYLRNLATADGEPGAGLRANRVSGPMWDWALASGGLGIVALVIALRLANRLVVLPEQVGPDFAGIPRITVISLLLAAAPIAGFIEEAAFRGYMQTPIERRHGLPIAILITGTMFAVAHLDFTPVLWPYYVAVAAIYGTVTHLTNSIFPAIVLHTAGNLYSNFDLWWRGRAEWQAGSTPAGLVWDTGFDPQFWRTSAALVVALALTFLTTRRLARLASRASRAAPDPPSTEGRPP